MDRRSMLRLGLSAAAAACLELTGTSKAFAFSDTSPFAKGVDVSSLPQIEAFGGKFYAGGVRHDALALLRYNGADSCRIKIWNDPGNAGYYPSNQAVAGYNTVAQAVALAKRAAALGMRILIDFHYSDWWVDPSKQYPPHAWAGLNLSDTCNQLYAFTTNALNQLKAAGITPEWVQVGNEITSGMLWPLGKYDQLDNLATLLKTGYNAVKSVNSATKVILHLDSGGNNSTSRWWFDAMTSRGVQFDVIGLSYYPAWQGSLTDLANNVNDIAVRYDKALMVVETAFAWTTSDDDSEPDTMTTAGSTGFPMTPAGQVQFWQAVKNIIANIPGGRGKGVFWWEPEWIPVAGAGWKAGAGDQWDNCTLFDFHGNALPSISLFKS